ncbi:Uncharacterised protein [uncultured archaeon]|nr:Uncharacterised protein [uncultured archaeon]
MSEKTASALRALLFAAFIAALFAGAAYAEGCSADAGQACDPNAPPPIGGGGTLSGTSPLSASMIKFAGCYCTPNMGLSCPRFGGNPKCCYVSGAPSGPVGNLATCYDATINAPRDDWCCAGLFCSSYYNTPEYGGYKCRGCFKEGEGQQGNLPDTGCAINPSRCCAGSTCDTATNKCIYSTCHQEGVDCTNDATNGRQCCSGLFCYGQPSGPKSCISCIGAGGLCDAVYGGSTCCSGNKCVLDGSTNQKLCKTCGAENDGCTAAGGGPDNSLCCSGLTCTETDPVNHYYNCKPGNNPPAQPASASIAALGGGSLLPDGQIQCIGNCPPSSLPPDPENNPVHMEYRWVRTPTGQPAVTGAWGASPSNFACSGVCAAGDSIMLQSRACDSLNACSAEVNSAAGITVSEYPCSHETQTCAAPRTCCTGESLTCQSGTCTKIIPPPAPTSINLNYFILAFVIVIALIALAYMASYVFSMPHWRPIIQDELLQVMVTAAVAVLLLSLQAGIDSELSAVLAGTGNTAPLTMMQAAQNTLSETGSGLGARANAVLGNLAAASTDLGRESSKSIFCNFMGVGFTLANCSPLNAYRGGLTVSAFTTTVAITDLYAQQFLLSLAANYAFNLLIPLGLFLRCFKVSRQAGGSLIAIGFGFYTVFPTVVVATESMLHGSRPAAPQAIPSPGTCDATETDVAVSLAQFRAYGNSLTNFDLTESTAYFVLVRVIFMSILNLIITLGFIRTFAHVIGSEIDVSALARIS